MPIQTSLQTVTRADLRGQNARPILRVSRHDDAGRFMWLSKGREGNLQTAAEMAGLVREDTMRDAGLGRFAAQLLINAGLDSHSKDDEVFDCVFRYVQRIKYIHDPGGAFDDINSARETLRKGYGDCDDLSVLLATLLALLGFTPAFVLAKYQEDTNGFDHVYVQVDTDSGAVVLDPTTRTHGVGWENPNAIDRVIFPIFGHDGSMNALGRSLCGSVLPVANAGAGIALSFIPVVGPIISALLGPIEGLFSKAQQKGQEAARWAGHEQVMAAMDAIQQAVDTCQITPAAGADAARQVTAKFYAMCDASFKSNVAQSCRNYGSEAGGFDYRAQKIASSGLSCGVPAPSGVSGAVAATSATGSSSGDLSLGGLSVSLPVALLIGAGVLMLVNRS